MWLPLNIETATPDFITNILHSNALNFILAVVVLGLIAKKMNLGNALGQQQAKLANAVQQMELQKHQTQQALNQLKQRSEVLHREIDQILSESRQSADKLAQQIIGQAEHEAARIRQQALAQQEQMLRLTKQQVQQQFMQDVLSDTEAQLKQRIGQVNPHDAIDHFIHALPMVASQVK